MVWSTRGTRKYYYRKELVNGRWRKVYVGTGASAEIAAQSDAEHRKLRATSRRQQREDREHFFAAEAVLIELSGLTDKMTKAALILAGFHQHERGAWRKRRTQR